MKFGKRAKITVMTLALISPATALAPSFAAPGGPPLIDKEFETAVRKFVSRRFFNRIEATDEQREKLFSIIANTQDKSRTARERLRQGLLQLSN